MTMWKERIVPLLLSVAIGVTAGAAVWRFAPAKPQFTPGQINTGVTYEVLGVPSDEIVVSVDGNGASAELLTYQIGSNCAYLDYMLGMYSGSGLDLDSPLPSGDDPQEYVREQSLYMLKQLLVLENIAAQYDVTLSEEDEAELAAERAKLVEESGGEDAYRGEFYKLGFSEAGYDRLARSGYLYNALYDMYNTPGAAFYASDDVLHAYAAGLGWITADHILLSTVDPATRQPLDEAVVAEKRALAEDILAQLRKSADPVALFAELADQYSEDPGRAANPEGYTFTEGTMVESFDAAARALKEGEISDIVESEYGYHILLRRPLDVAAAVDAVRDEYFEVFFLAEVDRAEMETSPAVARFDVKAIYHALTELQRGA